MVKERADPLKQVVEQGETQEAVFFGAVMLSKQVLSTSADDLKDPTF